MSLLADMLDADKDGMLRLDLLRTVCVDRVLEGKVFKTPFHFKTPYHFTLPTPSPPCHTPHSNPHAPTLPHLLVLKVLHRVVDEGVDVLPEDLQELTELVEKEDRLVSSRHDEDPKAAEALQAP